ncbi:MAG: nucleotide pyrophosphohydrolase [Aestuariivirgaceae bacterium]
MPDHPDHHELTRRLLVFRDERDWRQFHSLKDLILSLNLEAAELLELTQWQEATAFEAAAAEPGPKQRIAEECADIFLYLLLICERTGIDLSTAAADKIKHNEQKYPVEKSKGSARKYTQL